MTTQQRCPSILASPDTGEQMYRLDIMTQDDVPEVNRVERRCFPNPWPASAYRRELQNPGQNYYVVLRGKQSSATSIQDHDVPGTRVEESEPVPAKALPRRSLLPIGLGRRQEGNGTEPVSVIGFAGMWLAFDEAHVTTIGIDPLYRGHGLGELLLLYMVDEAMARGANWLTLEVRVSNVAAQALYQKYGFTVHGARKRYYSDNNEDALIMWSRALSDPGFRADIETLRRALADRLGRRVDPNHLSPIVGRMSRAGTP